MFPQLKRCLQPSSRTKVQHCPQLQLHGATVQLREGTETRRVLPEPHVAHGADTTGAEK